LLNNVRKVGGLALLRTSCYNRLRCGSLKGSLNTIKEREYIEKFGEEDYKWKDEGS
jgi:hypothetical protein